MSGPRVRRFLLVAVLALSVAGIAAAMARADAPDVKSSAVLGGQGPQHPTQTGTATVDTATGHVTVTLIGGWSWPTHGSDCNTNRAGAGVGVNWFDPNDRGFHVTFFDVNGGPVDNTPGGPDDFGVGATGSDGLNTPDDVVHPTENDGYNTADGGSGYGTAPVVDIATPSLYKSWRGGCGVFSNDLTLVKDKNGNLSYAMQTVAHGNFGKANPNSVDSTGHPFDDPTPPGNGFSNSNDAMQGALLKHVYASTNDVSEVCALMYDVHSGTTAEKGNGVGTPGAQQNVTAGDQPVAANAKYSKIHNSDNGIEDNNNTPTGNFCPQFFFPTITTQLSKTSVSPGDSVSDTAQLHNASADASGHVTYTVYSDATCTTQFADAGTVTVTNGSVPGSNSVNFPNPGTFYWQASYTGDGKNAPSKSACTDEQLDVLAPAIHVEKTTTHTQVNAGEPIDFTVIVWNDGAGDAHDATLSDPLPKNPGLDWTIQSTGTGWGNPTSCSISGAVGAQTLNCGGAGFTIPAGTQKATTNFTVHIVSNTDKTTGGFCPGGSGVVTNKATIDTSNAGSDDSVAVTCVAAPDIQIDKTADAAQVSAGEQIGFTVTVFNIGTGDAKDVTLSDPLPANAGLNWSIQSSGSGWGNPSSCSITGAVGAQTLNCGGPGTTVPHGLTEAASKFTVHIVSGTTKDTGGDCQNTGFVTNKASVTTSNDGSADHDATTCVAAPSIQIEKTTSKAQVNAGEPIDFTVTVWNLGPGDAHDATLSDPLPANAGLNWSILSTGLGWGNSCSIAGAPGAQTLSCGGPGFTVAPVSKANTTFTVKIGSDTTKATGGDCPGTGTVTNTASVSTSNDGNPNSMASTCVAAPDVQFLKTPDAAQVNAGEQIGFKMTAWNTGPGDAHDVTLSDPLPGKAGLNWSIQSTGAGWTCSINGAVGSQTLSCGGPGTTVPAGTTQGGSNFTVHVISGTTAATGGVCPGGTGVIDNTGNLTTSNDGNPSSTASTCVAAPDIQFVKTADAAKVNVGQQIGFTMTTFNSGTGDAHDVTLNDPLPATPGLSWSIASQGTGWGGSCGIVAGNLTCGGPGTTVKAGTTQAASTFTVHVVSGTGAAAGGDCPGSGEVDNTGHVTTSNDGSGQSTASTCVQALVDLAITKSGSPASQELGTGNITWTMVVTNNGPDADSNVKISDPMPAGNTFVSATSTQGTCTGGAILNCSLGSMAAGATVTITLVTTPSAVGTQTNTVTVVGDRPETNTANNQATASVEVVGPHKPPVFCVAVSKVTPKQLFVGRKTKLTIHLTKDNKAVAGIKVRIKGPKLNLTTGRSNSKGVITKTVKLKKAGIMVFSPIASKRCNTKRIGVTGVFTPPVTG